MRMPWTAAVGVIALVLGGSGAVGAAERIEDAVRDAVGGAPDIVAVTVSEPDHGPLIAVSVEFADDPPLDTDWENYTDVVFIDLACDPEVALLVEDSNAADDPTDYIFGAAAVQLPEYLESGGHLYVSAGLSDVYYHVVDVEIDGKTVTWTVDRKLLGDPDVLSWVVLAGIDQEEPPQDAYDLCPDEGLPRGVYTLTKTWR